MVTAGAAVAQVDIAFNLVDYVSGEIEIFI